MVLFYTALLANGSPVTVYAGKDKVENEVLIANSPSTDIWLHVDKLSSPHIYLRLPKGLSWEGGVPKELLDDCGQLVKAGSIMGNKKDNVTIIYTPASNLLKTGDMATGSVSFKNDRLVRRHHIPTRINAVVNRLAKSKIEREVDHEAERVEREKEEQKEKRRIANEKKNADLELSRARKAESDARNYDSLGKERSREAMTAEEEEEEWLRKQKEGDFDPDEDFM